VHAEGVEFRCVFTSSCEPDDGCARTDELSLGFLLGLESGQGFLVDTRGSSPVSVHYGDAAVTFGETLTSGAVQTTTISEDGQAVYSRDTYKWTEHRLVPEQYYGSCEQR